ncbi:cellulose binding domain-containing protein [Actinomadura sp. NPDC047616]|uniref:cellulose binding domain-containing protein n=1 Tax=Actinomadura sp. NPDC047616 TaxID=3155914 RepID=UPI003409319A
MLALVIAVGVVAYAFSTQQISLNFAGGAPSEPHTGNRESQVSERGQGDRASRGAERADGLVVAFRVASRTETGYRATATVTNRGSQPVARWALAFRIKNSRIVSFSGASVVRTGTTGHVRSRPGAQALAPGQSVRIVFVGTGTPHGPYYCVLNRLRCTRV